MRSWGYARVDGPRFPKIGTELEVAPVPNAGASDSRCCACTSRTDACRQAAMMEGTWCK